MARLLSHRELKKIPRATIIGYILEGIDELKKDISLNLLDENIELVYQTKDRQIKVFNLISLLRILLKECKWDPLSGKIIQKTTLLSSILKKIAENSDPSKLRQWLENNGTHLPFPHTTHNLNSDLIDIIRYLEEWQHLMLNRLNIPLGNAHTRDLYHPEFPETYKYKPKEIPDDYHSNFFFEIRVKELNFGLTAIQLIHPFSDYQIQNQQDRPLSDLMNTVIHFDFSNPFKNEEVDNIRAIRMHGLADDKQFPGSYIVIKGGVHRLREIYKRHLIGQISGEEKIIIQLARKENFYFQDGKYLERVKDEIPRRERLRDKLTQLNS